LATLGRNLRAELLRDAHALLSGLDADGEAIAKRLVTSAVDTFFVAPRRNLAGVGDELAPAVGKVAHAGGRELGVGVLDGLDPARVRLLTTAAGEGFAIGARRGFRDDAHDIAIAAAVAMGLLTLGLAAGLTILWLEYRKSALALRIVTNEIEAGDADVSRPLRPLKRNIQRHAEQTQVGPWLARFLSHGRPAR
jgi:hypothetical protein